MVRFLPAAPVMTRVGRLAPTDPLVFLGSPATEWATEFTDLTFGSADQNAVALIGVAMRGVLRPCGLQAPAPVGMLVSGPLQRVAKPNAAPTAICTSCKDGSLVSGSHCSMHCSRAAITGHHLRMLAIQPESAACFRGDASRLVSTAQPLRRCRGQGLRHAALQRPLSDKLAEAKCSSVA